MPNQTRKKKKVEAASDADAPVIECFCGVKFLLVPNVKQMSQAIEVHAEEHAKKIKTQREKDEEVEKVRDDLIIKLLEKASET